MSTYFTLARVGALFPIWFLEALSFKLAGNDLFSSDFAIVVAYTSLLWLGTAYKNAYHDRFHDNDAFAQLHADGLRNLAVASFLLSLVCIWSMSLINQSFVFVAVPMFLLSLFYDQIKSVPYLASIAVACVNGLVLSFARSLAPENTLLLALQNIVFFAMWTREGIKDLYDVQKDIVDSFKWTLATQFGLTKASRIVLVALVGTSLLVWLTLDNLYFQFPINLLILGAAALQMNYVDGKVHYQKEQQESAWYGPKRVLDFALVLMMLALWLES